MLNVYHLRYCPPRNVLSNSFQGPLTYGTAGEVDGGEGRVVLPGSHDVTGQAVVGELRLAVQEGVAAEVDVCVVAGGGVGQGERTWHRETLQGYACSYKLS